MAAEATEILARAGRALYGEMEWQAPFARALGVSLRTLQRWLAGQGEPHPDVLHRAFELVNNRAHKINAARADLKKFLDK